MSNSPWFIEPLLPESPKLSTMMPPLGGSGLELKDAGSYSSDKSLLDMLEKLENTGVLTEMEWILVLRLDEQYRSLNKVQLNAATQTVWSAMLKDEERFTKLTSKLVGGLARGYISLAEALTLSFPREMPHEFRQATKRKARLTSYLLSKEYSQCAQYILDQRVSIMSYFLELGLDAQGEHVQKIASHAESILPVDPSTHQLTWWCSCQEHLEGGETVNQLEQLLMKIRVVSGRTPFEAWITNRCLPDSTNTYWYSLTQKAQLKLKSFFNVTEYSTVSKVFDLLIETSDVGDLNEHQIRNLRSRISFWGHYTHEFKRVRFFLTERSSKLLGQRVNLEDLRVQTMQRSYLNDQSEICIFDVGEYFIVERFIGSQFDLGVFEKTEQLERTLFGRNYLDAEDISKLEPDWVHHHLAHYQRRFAQFLRRLGISPNKSGERWLKPLKPDELAQIDESRERHYRGVLDKTILFKTGKRY
ncbi:hypothetical protein [Vibrio maritimus]|uniref:hypothetical protein n=1 Tax=Vibrio maritimus TaxID=990268 RepID=UPI0037370842